MLNESLHLHRIQLDQATQPRVETDQETIDRYAERLRAGDGFPPIVVFFDGKAYWLADGFHRVLAHIAEERKTILADVRPGTKRDAIFYALQANAMHGKDRTPEDKRRSIRIILLDRHWRKEYATNRAIGALLKVSPQTVASVREELDLSAQGERIAVQRNGRPYDMTLPKPLIEPPEDEETDLPADTDLLREAIELAQELKTILVELKHPAVDHAQRCLDSLRS
jgi:hypothetical protein